MSAKILINGQPNTGKSTLLKALNPETSLVISRDGKAFPFAIPHKIITDFTDVDDLIAQISAAIEAFIAKYDKNPETIAIDSISKMLLDIESKILNRIKSFPYGQVNIEISKLAEFLEVIAAECNLVIVSHTMYDEETNSFKLVNAGGSWGKKGKHNCLAA